MTRNDSGPVPTPSARRRANSVPVPGASAGAARFKVPEDP